jgi:hypothetical protein
VPSRGRNRKKPKWVLWERSKGILEDREGYPLMEGDVVLGCMSGKEYTIELRNGYESARCFQEKNKRVYGLGIANDGDLRSDLRVLREQAKASLKRWRASGGSDSNWVKHCA